VEGKAKRAPFKEFRQFYFGSLHNDNNTFLREWPHVPFETGVASERTPRTTVAEAAWSEKFVDGPAFNVARPGTNYL
jgi:hypothetical protein